MRYRTCREAYTDGVESRLTYPLRSGLYKLVESVVRIKGSRQEIIRIMEVVGNIRSPASLRHCTMGDKAYWLKDVPLDISFRIGYEIIPSLRALEFDGVPRFDAIQAADLIESRIGGHLVSWEGLRNAYLRNISIEYGHMLQARSNALGVVDGALGLIESVVTHLPEKIKNDL
jgi:hypothetical protein